MSARPLVTDSPALRIDQVSVADGEVVRFVHSARPVRPCPQGGRRVARQSYLPLSGDTNSRALRRMASPSLPEGHVIGVGDWARCLSQR